MYYGTRQLTTDYMNEQYGKKYDVYEYNSFDNNKENQLFVAEHTNGDVIYIFRSPIDGKPKRATIFYESKKYGETMGVNLYDQNGDFHCSYEAGNFADIKEFNRLDVQKMKQDKIKKGMDECSSEIAQTNENNIDNQYNIKR